MIEPLPLELILSDRVERQVRNALLLSIIDVFGSDGIVRERKAVFDNGAVLRMTVAVPYSIAISEPEPGEYTAGPSRA